MNSRHSQQSGVKLRKLLEDYYSHIDRFVDALQSIHIQAQKINVSFNPEKVTDCNREEFAGQLNICLTTCKRAMWNCVDVLSEYYAGQSVLRGNDAKIQRALKKTRDSFCGDFGQRAAAPVPQFSDTQPTRGLSRQDSAKSGRSAASGKKAVVGQKNHGESDGTKLPAISRSRNMLKETFRFSDGCAGTNEESDDSFERSTKLTSAMQNFSKNSAALQENLNNHSEDQQPAEDPSSLLAGSLPQASSERNKRLIEDHLKQNQRVEYSKTIHQLEPQADLDDNEDRSKKAIAGVVGGDLHRVFLMICDDVKLYSYDLGRKSSIEEYLVTNLVNNRGGKEMRQVLWDASETILGIGLILSGVYQLDLFLNRDFVTNFVSAALDSTFRLRERGRSSSATPRSSPSAETSCSTSTQTKHTSGSSTPRPSTR